MGVPGSSGSNSNSRGMEMPAAERVAVWRCPPADTATVWRRGAAAAPTVFIWWTTEAAQGWMLKLPVAPAAATYRFVRGNGLRWLHRKRVVPAGVCSVSRSVDGESVHMRSVWCFRFLPICRAPNAYEGASSTCGVDDHKTRQCRIAPPTRLNANIFTAIPPPVSHAPSAASEGNAPLVNTTVTRTYAAT